MSLAEAYALAQELAQRTVDRARITKRQLDAEWHVSIEDAIEMEARAQARCMETNDFKRAYEAFADKRRRCSRATDGACTFLVLALFRSRASGTRGGARQWCASKLADAHGDDRRTLPRAGRASSARADF